MHKDSDKPVMPAVAMPGQRMIDIHSQRVLSPQKNNKSNMEGGLDAQKAVHAQYVLQLLQLQRRAGFLCDITIHVKDHSFKAHKPLLAACSLYFRGLFANVDSKESAALNLTSLTPNGFQVLLDYIYSGSLAITAENSCEVLSAAICLQMTNVVETCLSYMRSSFQISKSVEPTPLPVVAKSYNDSANRLALPDHVTEKHSSNYNTAHGMPDKKDQLQIVSTQSIEESEFKSMVIDVFHGPPSEKQPGASTHQFVTSNHLPNITQLDPVFGNYPTSHRVQEAATQLQKVHASVAGSLVPTSIISNNKARSCLLTSNPRSPPAPNFFHKSQNSHFHQPSHETIPTSLAVGIATKPPAAVIHLFQNGTLQNGTIATDLGKVSSAKDLATSSSAAHLLTTPERNSGIAQAEMVFPGFKENEATPFIQNRIDSWPEQYSSDEPGNKVEISSEEDSEYNAWSADRSVMTPSDLSVTPCTVVTQTRPSQHHKNLSNAPSIISSLKTNSVSLKTCAPKTASLPSLSPKIPINIPRALSSEDRPAHEVMHVDSALRAVASPNLSSSPIDISLNTSDGIDGGFSKHTSLQQQRQGNPIVPANAVFDDAIKFLKVEAGSDYEKVLSASTDFPNYPSQVPRTLEGDADSAQPQYFLKDHVNVGAKENDDCGALDLSMPQHGARRNSSTQSNDHSLHASSIQDSDSDSIEKRCTSRHHSDRSSASDSGIHLAPDTFCMLKQSNQSPTKQSCTESPTEQWSDLSSENSIKPFLLQHQASNFTSRSSQPPDGPLSLKRPEATFSRKPRRTNGGQTCTWPGCGKLIRHRHMFEEHLRQHELGTPGFQFRKCYTGARVKKTVREQLEELRTNDNVFDGTSDAQTTKQSRVGKRKAAPDRQEPSRKRVTAKDRSEAFHMQPVATILHPTSRPFVQHPSMRIHQSFSHPPLLNEQPPNFIQPSTPTSTFPGSSFIQVVDSNGITQTVKATNDLTSSQSTTTAHSASGGSSAPPMDVGIPRTSVPCAHSPSPVEATLALLEIRTPTRGITSSIQPKHLPVSNVSAELMRRRSAIRETTDARTIPTQGVTDLRVLVSASGTLTKAKAVDISGTTAHRGVLL